eukprot:3790324-Rhodomonas_salina.1
MSQMKQKQKKDRDTKFVNLWLKRVRAQWNSVGSECVYVSLVRASRCKLQLARSCSNGVKLFEF